MKKFVIVEGNIISVADIVYIAPSYSFNYNYYTIFLRNGQSIQLPKNECFEKKEQMDREMIFLLNDLNT